MKLIHAGKVLENGKTLAESRAHAGDLPGGVVTMHVVVQPAVVNKKTGLFCYVFRTTSICWLHFIFCIINMWGAIGYSKRCHLSMLVNFHICRSRSLFEARPLVFGTSLDSTYFIMFNRL